MGFKLNPGAVEFFPASGHRRGKRADWRWTSVSKQQIRYAGGDERCDRRRVGPLNPLSGETHKQGMYLDRWTKQKISNRKKRFAPTPTLDNRYDVRRAQTSGTGMDKQHFPRDLRHRSGKSIRLGRSCAIMGNTCPFWSPASDDQGHPHVSRWYEGSRTVG